MTLRNGFLIVASITEEYVKSANYCAHSIRDNYPDAHITLFVPNVLKKYVEYEAFDIVVSDDVPNHVRTKMYALSRTPYSNLTVYVDADMECMHQDVSTVWNEIEEHQDMLITKIRPYNGKISKWKNGEFTMHGGFFMYRNKPNVIEFMRKWYEDYVKQRAEPWPYDEDEYPKALEPWDQFTLWKLINLDKMPITVNFFKDDARWNFVNGYYRSETKSPIIFWHHTVPSKQIFIGIK
jgi:hypothetical protein